jgi:ATP-dependent Clp protease adapter protein ClpS
VEAQPKKKKEKKKHTTDTMVRLSLLTVSLFATAFGINAFIVPSPTFTRSVRLQAEGDKEGGAAIAKPKIKTLQKTETKTKEKQQIKKKAQVDEPKSRRKEEFQDAPLYRVMLLGDDSYDIGHVIERMCAIMEDLDEDAASKIYQQAQQKGKAMCGKYPLEHAEMYKEQLIRSDPMIFSDLEDENK